MTLPAAKFWRQISISSWYAALIDGYLLPTPQLHVTAAVQILIDGTDEQDTLPLHRRLPHAVQAASVTSDATSECQKSVRTCHFCVSRENLLHLIMQ